MKLWHVRGRWLLTDSDVKPKHTGETEYARCQILGDYPTRDKALIGARMLIKRRKEMNDRYA